MIKKYNRIHNFNKQAIREEKPVFICPRLVEYLNWGYKY